MNTEDCVDALNGDCMLSSEPLQRHVGRANRGGVLRRLLLAVWLATADDGVTEGSKKQRDGRLTA